MRISAFSESASCHSSIPLEIPDIVTFKIRESKQTSLTRYHKLLVLQLCGLTKVQCEVNKHSDVQKILLNECLRSRLVLHVNN